MGVFTMNKSVQSGVDGDGLSGNCRPLSALPFKEDSASIMRRKVEGVTWITPEEDCSSIERVCRRATPRSVLPGYEPR